MSRRTKRNVISIREDNNESTGPRSINFTSEEANEDPNGPWLDPNYYTKIVDDEIHVSKDPNYGEKSLEMRGSWQDCIKIYNKLCGISQNLKSLIDHSGWERLFWITTSRVPHTMVTSLVVLWWDTTHTFHFPCGELGITPLDFTMLTGIPICNGNPPPYKPKDYTVQNIKENFFPDLCGVNYLKSRSIILSKLKLYFTDDLLTRVNNINYPGFNESCARAFLLFVIGSVFFPNAASTVNIGWLSSIADLDTVSSFDCGGAILVQLYMALDVCSRGITISFTRMWQLIPFWFYEYVRVYMPFLQSSSRTAVLRPMIARWNVEERDRGRKNTVQDCYDVARQQTEMRTPESIVWEPWKGSSSLVEPDVQQAFTMSLRRCVFMVANQGVWYLGDRCWRQLTGCPAIPRNPRANMSLGPMQEYKICKARQWRDASFYVIPVDQREFDLYWKKVSAGPLMPPLERRGNIDLIGVRHISAPGFRVPYNSTNVHEPHVYRTPCPTISNEFLPPWSLDVPTPWGATTTIEIPRPDSSVPLPFVEQWTPEQWRGLASEALDCLRQHRKVFLTDLVWQNDMGGVAQLGGGHVDETGPSGSHTQMTPTNLSDD